MHLRMRDQHLRIVVGEFVSIPTRLLLPQTATAQHAEEVTPILHRQNGVQIRIGARVQRIEEDEQYLRFGNIDERIAGQCG